ncbi:sigma-70 family RNA polymerase sigma factor [Humisphaera borealis]|uniref:Sigma-70 family RNA polymerase sigma factor n=1 Tax=Humisphaera borealis TaxID=2807512 RepID=A0A7M2WTV6_9BACT|nr:sigma-70 family RNA polymerase sigma factor [Humisphaera borealis]QOV88704.1 sigma-70 family RNA polymerase sigma factor [Humisphaera borealis]
MDDPQKKARFAELLRGSQSRLLGYIHGLVRDVNDADDLFQQTAVILWNKFESYDPSRSFTAWACGVARLEISNFIRSRSRKKLYLSDDLNLLLIEAYTEVPEQPNDDEERKEALAGCLAKLRERDRELLLTCYTGEDDIIRIADRIGRSSQSVHNSLRRIREALYECVRRTLAQEAHPA